MAPSSIVPQADQDQTRSTMMAWRVHGFGPPNVMRFEKVPRPNPGLGEILVKVESAGVGPWDGWIRAGKSALPQPLPLTLGSDLSSGSVPRNSRGLRAFTPAAGSGQVQPTKPNTPQPAGGSPFPIAAGKPPLSAGRALDHVGARQFPSGVELTP